jgi:hypothetical protein
VPMPGRGCRPQRCVSDVRRYKQPGSVVAVPGGCQWPRPRHV